MTGQLSGAIWVLIFGEGGRDLPTLRERLTLRTQFIAALLPQSASQAKARHPAP